MALRRMRVLRSLLLVIVFALPVSAFAAGPPVSWAGSSWNGATILSAKVSGAGSFKGPAQLDLDFGPQADPPLAANEFLIELDDGTASIPIHGTWLLDPKGRPILTLDPSTVAADLKELLFDVCQEQLGSPECNIFLQLDVVIDPSKFKPKLKAKDDHGLIVLSATGKLPFDLFLQGDRVARASIGFKSKVLLEN